MSNKKKKLSGIGYPSKRKYEPKYEGIVAVRDGSSKRRCVASYCTFGILGLFFFFSKSNNNYVRFNGLQAALMNIPVLILVTILLRFLPYIVPSTIFFILMLFDMTSIVKCRKHLLFKYYYIGDLAEIILLKKYNK